MLSRHKADHSLEAIDDMALLTTSAMSTTSKGGLTLLTSRPQSSSATTTSVCVLADELLCSCCLCAFGNESNSWLLQLMAAALGSCTAAAASSAEELCLILSTGEADSASDWGAAAGSETGALSEADAVCAWDKQLDARLQCDGRFASTFSCRASKHSSTSVMTTY